MAAAEFLSAIQSRRTFYAISKKSSISDTRVAEIVKHSLTHIPSSFNIQTNRSVLLFGADHDKLWNVVVLETLRKIVPADQFAATQTRIAGFKGGYGTVMFFIDTDPIKKAENKFSLYQDRFAPWSEQSSGMFQHATWVALEKEGLGASLQHYNPLIDEEVRKAWEVPASWKLIAQMPFGVPTAQPGEKLFNPIETKIKIFGSAI